MEILIDLFVKWKLTKTCLKNVLLDASRLIRLCKASWREIISQSDPWDISPALHIT